MEPAEQTRGTSAGDFEAEALQFLPNVARYARLLTRDPADADDLTQETFLRAFASWSSFRPGTDCRKWLFTICRNIYLRDRQRSQRVVALDDPERELVAVRELYDAAVSSGFGGLFDRLDIAPAIERAVQDLQPDYREALMLVDIEDRTYAEAADVSGVPIGTIRSRLFRARRALQESLLRYAEDLGIGSDAHATAGQRSSR